MPPKPVTCGLIGGGGMVKDPIPDDDVTGFWLLHADELLFIADDQSMFDAEALVCVAEFCAGRYGMADGAEG